MLLTEKYADKTSSIVTFYDRMIIQRYILGWSYAILCQKSFMSCPTENGYDNSNFGFVKLNV